MVTKRNPFLLITYFKTINYDIFYIQVINKVKFVFLDILVSRSLVLCYNCFNLKMSKKNYKKIPCYLFYSFTLFIIIDFCTILARPLFEGYPIPHFWNASFEMHPFSWAFAVITITICVLFIKARKF